MRALALIALATTMGPGGAAAQDAAPASPPTRIQAEAVPAVTVEARAMMQTYAEVLRAGNRAGIADLYDPRGAWLIWEGQGRFHDHETITRRYAEGWSAPADFEWRDLTFMVNGPDRVTVSGRFLWTEAGRAPETLFYHGQFARHEGRLRIQVEHEGRIPTD